MKRNLKYTFPFGGDENHNQLEYNEFLGDSVDGTSSSVDYDQEKLYPTRKSLEEFEIEEICNDEIIHHKQNKNFTTKKSIKSNYQTSIYQKGNNADILSFENYQDEDIDDTPPGLAKESPLLFQQLEFRKEFVRNSLSQFQNNSKCMDVYKKAKMNRKLNKVKDGKTDFCYSEETELTSFVNTENYAPSSSKHLFQLKEMFKKNQIISNLHESRLQETNSALSIPGYDINDLEDDYYDINAQQNKDMKQEEHNEEANHKTITSFQLLEDQPFATKNFVQLDNQIRMQASMMKLSDELSQQYLTFTDTEDCLSLVSEKNTIGIQINNYQSNGYFSKNIFQSTERGLFPTNTTSIFEVKKDHILQNKEYFVLLASHYVWNSQVKEAAYIFSQLQDEVLYKVEISLNLLLITGQLRYLESSMTDYNQIVSMIDKKDKAFSSYSELDKKAILCEAHMGIGLLKVLQDKKLSALSSINTAHNYLSQIKKLMDSTKRKIEITDENKNRFLFVDGLFQIGLSLMPGFFSKIFSLLGINIDMKRGINCLTDCIDMKQIKSNYARIVLFLFYLEAENNILSSSNIIKSSLAYQSTSPTFNWLASLYYWKIASSSNAVKFIKQAIDYCEKYGHQPHFFYFELGWFYLSQFKWNQAIVLFENMIQQGFDFKQIEPTKFFKKLKSSKQEFSTSAQDYYKNFLLKYEQNLFGSKVKIMHKCCIAFIIGICYISKSTTSVSSSQSKIPHQFSGGSGQKMSNTQNYLIDDESNNLIHQILSPISQNDQFNSVNRKDTSRQLFNESSKQSSSSKPVSKQPEEPKSEELFYLWCNLALEIYDKLGDSKTLLDIEFRKIIKLFSTRSYAYLIKFELLYFVKELSKVSDENLEIALTDIKQYQEQHIQQYQNAKNEDNLVEICSAYLLIIGICYIKDKFHDIHELATNTTNLKIYLNQINKKYQYLSHHTYYWLGMSYKKNYMYQQARHFFEMSKQFKTNLFNLNSRIEANLTTIHKNISK